jgi:hypothetical protein
MNTNNIKEIVKEKYSHMARHSDKTPKAAVEADVLTILQPSAIAMNIWKATNPMPILD